MESSPNRRTYPSLLAELRRNIEGLSISMAVILDRGLRISRGGLLYAGAGEMADWLGDSDRRNAQRIRRALIDRGHLVVEGQRHRENGADSVLECRFAEAVLAVYCRWRDAQRPTDCRRPTTKCHRQLVPSSGFYKKPSEGAREDAPCSPNQDEISDGWIEAAANERRLAGLPDADLKLEWRKLVNRTEGQVVSRWRWIDWALKAHRCTPARKDEPAPAASLSPFKGREREAARVLGFYESGFWLRSWGPRPDQPGCEVEPAILAWAQETAASRRAAA